MKRLFICVLLSGLLLSGCGKSEFVLSEVSENNQETTTEYIEEEPEPEKVTGFVYVCGAVNEPGVYEFDEGARIFEVIDLAGGLDEDADPEALNLAALVKDGDRIRIPYLNEMATSADDGLVDLNSADVEKLCSVPGIGEAKALAIIEYRESNNGFNDIEELKNIPGIKESTFNKIKPYVYVR